MNAIWQNSPVRLNLSSLHFSDELVLLSFVTWQISTLVFVVLFLLGVADLLFICAKCTPNFNATKPICTPSSHFEWLQRHLASNEFDWDIHVEAPRHRSRAVVRWDYHRCNRWHCVASTIIVPSAPSTCRCHFPPIPVAPCRCEPIAVGVRRVCRACAEQFYAKSRRAISASVPRSLAARRWSGYVPSEGMCQVTQKRNGKWWIR